MPITENGVTFEKTKQLGLLGGAILSFRDLTSANTWYAVPATPPTTDYEVTFTRDNATGTVVWGHTNSGTPSTTNGMTFPSSQVITARLGASQSMYFASSVAGDDINYSLREL